jgi:hypothetical protein
MPYGSACGMFASNPDETRSKTVWLRMPDDP